MYPSDNNMNYVLKNYYPTREEAVSDFLHLYEKLKNGLYGDGDNPKEDLADWDDDYCFLIRCYYWCLFENFNSKQKEALFQKLIEIVIKRSELIKKLG